MQALVCHSFGALDTLRLEERPSPRPGPGEIVVSVKAAGVNWPDMLMVRGLYQRKPALPFTPGMELAGVVKSIGAGVTDYVPGDHVMAHLPQTGAFAQEVCFKVGPGLVKLPAGVDWNHAAVLPVAYATSLEALADRGRLQAGETLLVLGAAGGVGIAAVQIGKLMGARVIACASSKEKLAICREAGADEVIDYEHADLAQQVKALTAGRGVDMVFDPVGGRHAEPALRRIARNGRYLVVGFAAGIASIPLNLVLLKGCSVVGVALGMNAGSDPVGYRNRLRQLVAWTAEHRLVPHIGEVRPLAQAPDALASFEGRSPIGKIVMSMP